uniref:SH3 domain-binding glutamic acid-rich-like protein 3 n=1 Tax=Sinocyclocheilus anshuiensis TaxID=1608454 RepID=A0A671N0K1_9TELE
MRKGTARSDNIQPVSTPKLFAVSDLRKTPKKVKSQQAEVMRILESKSIKYELIDISVGGAVRDEMRSKSGNPTAIPPQIFNEDQYCGNYDMFSEAVEADTVEQFLKIA